MGEEIKNCVKPGSGPVFLWLRLLRFLVAADAFFRLLWLRFSVTVAAFSGCCGLLQLRWAQEAVFSILYTTIFFRHFLLPISCMFLIHISNVVGYRSSKQLVCAQPKRFLQYFGRFLSILRFRVVYRMQNNNSCAQPQKERRFLLCTAFNMKASVPNRPKFIPSSFYLPISQHLPLCICQLIHIQ